MSLALTSSAFLTGGFFRFCFVSSGDGGIFTAGSIFGAAASAGVGELADSSIDFQLPVPVSAGAGVGAAGAVLPAVGKLQGPQGTPQASIG